MRNPARACYDQAEFQGLASLNILPDHSCRATTKKTMKIDFQNIKKDLTVFNATMARVYKEQGRYREELGSDQPGYQQSGCCPIHNDHNPSCSFSVMEDGTILFNCFACDAAGTIFDLVCAHRQWTMQENYSDIIRFIKESMQSDHDFSAITELQPAVKAVVPKETQPLTNIEEMGCETLRLSIFREHLKAQRMALMLGFAEETLMYMAARPWYALGLSPEGGLCFLYTDENRKYIGVKARLKEPWATRFGFSMNGNPYTIPGPTDSPFMKVCGTVTMWGIHAIPGSTHCIITEGETDAIAAMDAILHSGMPEKEFPAIVSINGAKNITLEKAEYFRGKHILLAFDSDRTGEEGKVKATSLLAGIAASVHALALPNGKKDVREANMSYQSYLIEEILSFTAIGKEAI